ncbi:hypothetical protein PWR05_35855 [Paraburkholderia sp. A2RI-6]|uniref:hypothetical protein n=1 Tax=Paraburkholderia sp. A2RI-6 TaxID=3028371 RepID=UPI003B790C0C
MSLFETIQSDPPTWANDSIQSWDDILQHDMTDFVVRETFERDARVDMRDVIGQSGHDAGQTWLEAAVNPQYKATKMARMFDLYERNPDYYFNGELGAGDSLFLSSANGSKWYTDSGGNHRTVVAKSACDRRFRDAKEKGGYPGIRGAVAYRYEIDHESRDLYLKFRDHAGKGLAARPEKRETSKRSVASTTVIASDLTFFATDFRFNDGGRSQPLDAPEFRKFARHFLARDGKVDGRDRLRHLWMGYARGDFESLIYPA